MSADKFIKQRSAPVDPFDPEKYIDAFYSNVAWHNDAEDSMKFFQDCLLEAFKEGTGLMSMEERQDLLREKVRNIVFCDITQPNPTASTVVDGVTFDAITCSNCLEVASFTLDDYAQSVRNICTLLKPGGYFVLEGCLEISFYRLGDQLYECYPIKENDLQDIVQKAGLEIISMKVLNYTPRPEEYYYTDCESVFAIVARKV
ncbi:hypothetical protein ACJMK2_039290 [Sinanodonta woodiana]|uniref:Methyltransferase type 11 domain-containing protein n=1 Tax=Sinanodonta woodiana TaxID=1069815 RepID=A0ABD3WES6_SINWO